MIMAFMKSLPIDSCQSMSVDSSLLDSCHDSGGAMADSPSLFQNCFTTVDVTADTCCSLTACSCHTPDGTAISLGQVYKPNNTDSCTTCICVADDEGTSYLQCMKPVCPSLIGCPADRIRQADEEGCCPVCQDSVEYECTGK